ncbi:MAG: sialidase family protein [Methanobacteriota archaeon]
MRVLLPLLVMSAFAGCLDASDPAPEGSEVLPPASNLLFRPDCAVSNWADPCTALASPNDSPSKSEIDLAVNPKDPMNVIVGSKDLDPLASDCVWSVLQVTKDGGRTWKTVYVGGDRENREAVLRSFACITDPIMTFDADGIAYYALQAYEAEASETASPTLPVIGGATGGSAFVLARSRDGGETWDHYVAQNVGDGNVVFHDYPRMLVNPATGAVHTIWNAVGLGGVNPVVSTTRDQGETVDPPVNFFAPDSPRGTQFFSGFGVTADGILYVTAAKGFPLFADTDSGESDVDVWIFRSDDDGRSFTEVGKAFAFRPTPRQDKEHEFRTPSFVELAIDASTGPFSGRIYTFWPDYATGQSDILSSYSDDGAATWSAPIRLSDGPLGSEYFMRPTVGPDGTVHVLYMTTGFDPAGKLLDAMYAYSADGGITWTNQRLTNASFDGDLGIHQSGFPFIGDYNGIAVGPDGAVNLAWGDTRTGRAEIAFARVAPASDQ